MLLLLEQCGLSTGISGMREGRGGTRLIVKNNYLTKHRVGAGSSDLKVKIFIESLLDTFLSTLPYTIL